MDEQTPLPTSNRHHLDPALTGWLRLMRVFHKIDQRTAETMREFGLSVSRFDVINHAGTSDGRTQQEIADALLVTKGNITQLLDAMERDGLLIRKRDGRNKRIYLTERGKALRNEAVTVQEAKIVQYFASLSPEELSTLSAILRKLDRALD